MKGKAHTHRAQSHATDELHQIIARHATEEQATAARASIGATITLDKMTFRIKDIFRDDLRRIIAVLEGVAV